MIHKMKEVNYSELKTDDLLWKKYKSWIKYKMDDICKFYLKHMSAAQVNDLFLVLNMIEDALDNINRSVRSLQIIGMCIYETIRQSLQPLIRSPLHLGMTEAAYATDGKTIEHLCRPVKTISGIWQVARIFGWHYDRSVLLLILIGLTQVVISTHEENIAVINLGYDAYEKHGIIIRNDPSRIKIEDFLIEYKIPEMQKYILNFINSKTFPDGWPVYNENECEEIEEIKKKMCSDKIRDLY